MTDDIYIYIYTYELKRKKWKKRPCEGSVTKEDPMTEAPEATIPRQTKVLLLISHLLPF